MLLIVITNYFNFSKESTVLFIIIIRFYANKTPNEHQKCCSSSFLRYGTFLMSANPFKISLHQLERLEIGRRS